jgi:hypothetical protein
MAHHCIYANHYIKVTISCFRDNNGYANAPRYIIARSLSICYLHIPLLHSSKLAAVEFGSWGGGVHIKVLSFDCRCRGDELCARVAVEQDLYFVKYTANIYVYCVILFWNIV